MAPEIIRQVTEQDTNGNTGFMRSIINQNNEEFERFITSIKGIHNPGIQEQILNGLNTVNRNGENALILSAKYGTDIMVTTILKLYESYDEEFDFFYDALFQTDIDGNNAFMCSIIKGYVRNIGTFVEHMDPSVIKTHVNRNGDTVLLIALKSNAPNKKLIQSILIDRGRRLNIHNYDLPDRQGNTAKNLMTDELKEIAHIPFSGGRYKRKYSHKKRKNSHKKRKNSHKKRSRKH